ncbi:MAG TPA: serine/threonine-protein kinase [Nocardioidaceae bacterium]|nr:serine/threonine-protein kinase [Nocardioidaceae bacterium]
MSAATPPPAARVGPYLLLAKIGEGGMGLVYLARSPEDRRVALKVLRPHIVGDEEARERLAREVASLRRVRSPRVAEVIDADPWAETPYVATRYVPGLSLHQHVRRNGPIEGDDLRWFAAGLAEAVIAVHTVGVLHRDVKPSNVLLEGRSPVLIDFGLARVADDPRLTHTGWLLGTPGYLAPEILYGEDATTASDVHAWAATVVFAATGRAPFGSGPALAIMDRVRRGEHDLTGVPADLLPLVEQALAPDPDDRPETAAVLAALRPPAAEERTVRLPWSRRREQPTMPMVLAEAPDDDLTDVLDATAGTVTLSGRAAPVGPTRALPTEHTGWSEWDEDPELADRAEDDDWPFDEDGDWEQEPEAWSPAHPDGSRPRRVSVLIALFLLVVAGFAAAPYLSLVPIGIAALLLRTGSWTAESASQRRWRRGRRRWYDGPLTVLSTPWYLLVATTGTLVLMACAALFAFVGGVGYLLFRLPPGPVPALMGAVLGLSLWCGPGSRRVRSATGGMAGRLTLGAWPTRATVVVLVAGAVGCGYVAATTGVDWRPGAGAPWAPGTVLGGLLGS